MNQLSSGVVSNLPTAGVIPTASLPQSTPAPRPNSTLPLSPGRLAQPSVPLPQSSVPLPQPSVPLTQVPKPIPQQAPYPIQPKIKRNRRSRFDIGPEVSLKQRR